MCSAAHGSYPVHHSLTQKLTQVQGQLWKYSCSCGTPFTIGFTLVKQLAYKLLLLLDHLANLLGYLFHTLRRFVNRNILLRFRDV